MAYFNMFEETTAKKWARKILLDCWNFLPIDTSIINLNNLPSAKISRSTIDAATSFSE